MALTEFGKAIRKARIDASETLSSMAKAIGVSSSFLSSVENGKKKMPQDKSKKILLFLKDKGIEIANLAELIHFSNGYVPINHLSLEQKKLIALLAEKTLTINQLNFLSNSLKECLSQGENDDH